MSGPEPSGSIADIYESALRKAKGTPPEPPSPPAPPIAKRGDGPDDGGMEHRVTALETRLDTVLPTLATKTDIEGIRADLHKMDASVKTWMIATVVGLMIGFGGLFLNMASQLKPAPTPAPTQSPIVITVPYPSAQAVPAPPTQPASR